MWTEAKTSKTDGKTDGIVDNQGALHLGEFGSTGKIVHTEKSAVFIHGFSFSKRAPEASTFVAAP